MTVNGITLGIFTLLCILAFLFGYGAGRADEQERNERSGK